MYQQSPPVLDKYRPIVYAFIAGLVVGMLLGWFYHGFVGFLIRLLVLIPLVIVVVIGVMLWRGANRRHGQSTTSHDIEVRWRDSDQSGSNL